MTPRNEFIVERIQIQTYRKRLNATSDLQWMIIQDSGAWGKTWEYLHALTVCRFALAKLELAVVARYFGIGVDVGRAVQLLNQLKEPQEVEASRESQNRGENS